MTKQARALLAEALGLQALVHDDDRLYKEFPRQSRLIADTFLDYEDYWRYQWHGANGRERLLCARFLSIAQDLRIATRIMNGAVRYSNVATIEVKRAEIRDCVRRLSGLIRDGVAGPPDEAEQIGTVEALV